MIEITRAQFNELKKANPDYIGPALRDYTHGGKTCKKGENTAFEFIITGGKPNTTLIFENIHFKII